MFMRKLVLIDGNAILHRAYHALPPLITKKGEPINAVYGLVSMLLRVIMDLKPTHIAVAFDEKEPTFRHKEFPSYQAQRPSITKELSSQFDKARSVFESIGIPVYSKPGFEADDIIGTIANSSVKSKKIDEVIIITGDRDILQLVGTNVKVYMPVVGLTNARLMGPKEVVEKIGVFPGQIPDYKALVGDPSDNYPGIPGVGSKTAIELIKRFKTLENIYKHLDEIPKKIADKLKEKEKEAKLYLRLATVVKDVPLKFELEEASRWDIDNSKVVELFSEFGFKTLTQRVKKIAKELDQEKQMTLL